ncbi:TIGR02452 family protein [Teredinibacter sp. KSP-S5-2]|uniref:TIGR02452 family protein n=1 Tax=Teredinibacter sp. KSP-S5-2 TaxID=3034506 RepID=UPI0029342508|nr:TIGR02452 family protein [Teredinibacter sp. KSP-S5-2]WNO10875.1 TIGR02452 family protein [Teredinibacter sp. KSP-S5-2]
MTNRNQRSKIAHNTLEILEAKKYLTPNGVKTDISSQLSKCVDGSIHYTPETLDILLGEIDPTGNTETQIEVINETTFAGAKTLLNQGNGKVLCLNFASAKNPGGGFIGGSQAQEEALTRASGLYDCLSQYMDMYIDNRTYKSCLYRNHIIYSPDVPVFRDEMDELIEAPWSTSIITAPAVNYGALKENEKEQAETVMRERIDMVLAIAYEHEYKNLVLGAWGCGVFRNDPYRIAAYFCHSLSKEGRFHNSFERVRFSVFDRSENTNTYTAFKEILEPVDTDYVSNS